MNSGRWRLLVATAVVALAAFGAGLYLSPPPSRPPAGNLADGAVERLFGTTLTDVSGKQHPVNEWRGRPLIVNFWATWCAPCLKEMPLLSKLQAEHPEITIIGIAADVDANVLEFAANAQMTYPLLLGAKDAFSLMTDLGNARQALPYTVAIDASGAPVAAILGGLDEATAQQILAELTQRR